jgi:N-hydroxyarylamine O-acetyltransferase
MCRYHQTSPDSHFTQKRLCSRATPEGRVTISDHRLITNARGSRDEKELASEEEYLAALRDLFDIRL